MVERVKTRPIISVRTRLIVYGGLAVCTLLVLFGPQIAAVGLSVLGCPLGNGMSGAACGGLLDAPARALASWGNVAPPVETLFLLLQQLWPLLLAWGGAVFLSVRVDRAEPSQVQLPPLESAEGLNTQTSTGTKLSEDETRAQWVRARQREQAVEEAERKRTLTQQLFAEARFLGITAVSCWVLIFGLFTFCVAFGIPLLGGLTADTVLHSFGCLQPPQFSVDPMTNVCGLLEERLAPYRKPFFGALLSPVWLFTQFSDLLLLWLGSILLVAALPVFRLGVRRVLRTHRATVLALFAVSILSMCALVSLSLLGAPEWTSARLTPSDPTPAIAALEVIFSMAVVLLVLVLAFVFCLVWMLVMFASRRHGRTGSNPP